MKNAPRVLVVDDEPAVRALVERVLKREGFDVILSANAKEGLQALQEHSPDLIILDLNLPDIHGEEICRRIRKESTTPSVPILILTGCSMEGLTAQCLDEGADDYLNKPFDTKELGARVRALLRRPGLYASHDTLLQKKHISIHRAERKVLAKGRPVNGLAPKEFEILYQLVLHAPNVLDKNTLAFKVWGVSADQVHSRTLDVHIRRIRQKLGEGAASYLKTIPAVGFQWNDPD